MNSLLEAIVDNFLYELLNFEVLPGRGQEPTDISFHPDCQPGDVGHLVIGGNQHHSNVPGKGIPGATESRIGCIKIVNGKKIVLDRHAEGTDEELQAAIDAYKQGDNTLLKNLKYYDRLKGVS